MSAWKAPEPVSARRIPTDKASAAFRLFVGGQPNADTHGWHNQLERASAGPGSFVYRAGALTRRRRRRSGRGRRLHRDRADRIRSEVLQTRCYPMRSCVAPWPDCGG
jgi:hypothetical protein